MMLHCWQKTATLLMDISMDMRSGGTNPSFLRHQLPQKLNLLLDVGFNKEVGKMPHCTGIKKNGKSKPLLIQKADTMDEAERERTWPESKDRMKKWYSWGNNCTAV